MPSAFTTQRLIRFAHCDPAGIVSSFEIRGKVGGDEKFRARHKVALVSLESFHSMPIPDDMRSKMREYCV